MPFKYSCFISYCHGQRSLIESFIRDLKAAIESYLELYLDEEVYIDFERLDPGHLYNEALARAICRSLCMIVVYYPRYEKHPYCRRECVAMEKLEKRRFQMLREAGEASGEERGMIIPVILGGKKEDLPPRLKRGRKYHDFATYRLQGSEVTETPEWREAVDRIAWHIYELSKEFQDNPTDPFGACESFQLPGDPGLSAWREGESAPPPPFPGREPHR